MFCLDALSPWPCFWPLSHPTEADRCAQLGGGSQEIQLAHHKPDPWSWALDSSPGLRFVELGDSRPRTIP